eukprot:gnl/TRDRNA2_/TRDRNA2_68932_c0_seq1.p1 gnl/TRDRNA2_/TRDRNA2_68932_c0~~gnl/TRDRNA2_/TRDRNA2_68932_c0_seq1.p1  ORF type:complete len:430 (+),score=90.01 gnl/TRDRNA2_/TRDRNA2_68932_c0_seq1:142-1290(+)
MAEMGYYDENGEPAEGGGPRMVDNVAPFGDNDDVEVFYTEFLLASWVLDHAPWNAFHSGLAFINNATGRKVLYDYTPEDPSSVMKMIIPKLQQENLWKALVLGEVHLFWDNEAHVQHYPYWPANYSNYVRLGKTKGKVFNRFAHWVNDSFRPTHATFDAVEALVVGENSNPKSKDFTIRSCMCHDFVTDSLWELYNAGMAMEAEDHIFRDHIIMYAKEIEPVSLGFGHFGRQRLRYFRTLHLFVESVKVQFTYARDAIISNWKMGIPVVLRSRNQEYRVWPTAPFLNYCYLPLAIPPKVADPLGDQKLCALPMQARIDNITVPFPMGALLAVEQQLDRGASVITLVLVAFIAAVVGSCSGDATEKPAVSAKTEKSSEGKKKK